MSFRYTCTFEGSRAVDESLRISYSDFSTVYTALLFSPSCQIDTRVNVKLALSGIQIRQDCPIPRFLACPVLTHKLHFFIETARRFAWKSTLARRLLPVVFAAGSTGCSLGRLAPSWMLLKEKRSVAADLDRVNQDVS